MTSSSPQRPVGVFVAFEGGEGGKSTQLTALAERLRGRGREVVVTREPGGSPRAETIRELILAPSSHDLDARCEALLFAAARADHVATVVRPALESGAVVLCDRYLDSSVAYQGAARSLGEQRVRDLSLWATDHLVPDLTVVLDIDPRVGLSRAQDASRLEAEPLDFHDEVRGAFLRFAEQAPERYLVVDAAGDRDTVAATIAARVDRLLGIEVSA
ncbi:MAG: dTMP kinase [Candidatus Nanopelagicales bacterium]